MIHRPCSGGLRRKSRSIHVAFSSRAIRSIQRQHSASRPGVIGSRCGRLSDEARPARGERPDERQTRRREPRLKGVTFRWSGHGVWCSLHHRSKVAPLESADAEKCVRWPPQGPLDARRTPNRRAPGSLVPLSRSCAPGLRHNCRADAVIKGQTNGARLIVFRAQMESLVREMQDPENGVPVRSQKLFLTSIPSAFMGQ